MLAWKPCGARCSWRPACSYRHLLRLALLQYPQTSNPNVPAGGGSFGAVTVTAAGTNCQWTAASNVPWMQVTFGKSGNGSGSFGYGVDPNRGAARTGSITVAGLPFSVTQSGCTFALTPSSASYPFGGGNGSFTVQPTPSSCTWTGITASDWITLTSASGGPGSGTLRYSVTANPTPFARSGNIALGNQTFSVTEDRAPCVTTLTPGAATASVDGTSGTFRIAVAPNGCTWSAASGSSFVMITSGASGMNSGPVGYTVAANTGGQRSAAIRVNDQTFNITQDPCTYTAVADRSAFGVAGGPGAVAIATSSACPWTAASSADFVTLGATSGTGSARVGFAVAANPGPARSGNMTVAGQTITLEQESAPPPQLDSVKNGASYTDGPVSPGEVVTLFGSRLGPDDMVNMQTTDDGTSVTTLLAGTRVLFDGVPAPIVFAMGTQVSAVTPYGLDGKTSTQVQVEYQGLLSNALTLDVVAATPGVYSLDSSGSGQALVLNDDFSFNGKDKPATLGSVIQIYATGGGQTTPPGIDGKLIDTPQPQLNLPAAVRIGGVDAAVQSAGGAQGMIAGRVQVSVTIPDGVQPGDAVPVLVQFGDAWSQDAVTIAVAAAQ
jgi:uncharacterized protein (TIGR03437 family)